MAPETTVLAADIVGSGSSPQDATAPPLSTKDLERRLTSHAGHMAAAEGRWLGWLDQWCRREGWAEWGCSGPVQWLSWQCGMSPSTARDKVRVAAALAELPTIAKRLNEGRLSYSKVRALTRIATTTNEADLAELGVAATGAQLDVIVRSYKQARSADDRAGQAWRDRSWRSRADGPDCTVFTLRVPNDQADLVREQVTAQVDQLVVDSIGVAGRQSRDEVLEQRGGYRAVSADAVVALINGTPRTTIAEPLDLQVVVNDDDHSGHQGGEHQGGGHQEAGATLEYSVGASPVLATVGERLCCDPRISVLVEQSKSTVLGVGRKTRLIGRKLRRALERRDGGRCVFPGCCSTKGLHAHHIIHWANGGPTELANLTLVCSFHHHLVHEGGWSIDPTTHRFIKPDGTWVDPLPDRRFRGSADQTTSAATFKTLAPLAEAENEPYDLGLVLESLAEPEQLFQIYNHRCRQRSNRPYGPALPAAHEQERERLATLKRFRGSAAYQPSAN